jgi:hypothetical protein
MRLLLLVSDLQLSRDSFVPPNSNVSRRVSHPPWGAPLFSGRPRNPGLSRLVCICLPPWRRADIRAANGRFIPLFSPSVPPASLSEDTDRSSGVPGGCALGSWRIRQPQVGPSPLPGLSGAVNAKADHSRDFVDSRQSAGRAEGNRHATLSADGSPTHSSHLAQGPFERRPLLPFRSAEMRLVRAKQSVAPRVVNWRSSPADDHTEARIAVTRAPHVIGASRPPQTWKISAVFIRKMRAVS